MTVLITPDVAKEEGTIPLIVSCVLFQGSTSTLGGVSPSQPLSPLSGRSPQGGHWSPSPFAAGALQHEQGGRLPATALQASSPSAGAAKTASSLPSHKVVSVCYDLLL